MVARVSAVTDGEHLQALRVDLLARRLVGTGPGQYKTLDDLRTAMKDDQQGTLTDEWQEVQKIVTIKVNSGQIAQRLKGNKRGAILQSMADARHRIVELVKSEGTRVIEPMRAITLARWMQKYPNSDPKGEGHIVKPISLPGDRGLICMCALLQIVG